MSTFTSTRHAVLEALFAQISPGLSGAGLLALAQGWARLTSTGAGNAPLTEAEFELAERVRGRLLETVTTVAVALAGYPTASVARAASESHASELRDLAACVFILQAPPAGASRDGAQLAAQ